MPRHLDVEDDWEEDDYGDDDETPTVPCPYCRRDVAEDSPRCPYCERYLTTEDMDPDEAVPPGRTWGFWIGAVVCLIVAILWVIPW